MRAVRWVTMVTLGLVGVASIVLAYVTVFVSGMGWDAAFESYASLLIRPIDPSTTTLAQAYDIAPVTSEWYGVLIYQIADGLRLLIFREPEWLAFTAPETYLWVFGVNAGYAIIGVTIFALGVGAALRSRLVAAFTWAATLATPLFIGHAAMNYKDMPVAAGLCAVSGGLMLGWRIRRFWVGFVITVMSTFAGVTMAVGARGGAVVLFALVLLGSLGFWGVACLRTKKFSAWLATGAGSILGLLAAVVLVLWSNPIARIEPLTWLIDSIVVAGQYPWIGPIRFNGVDVMSDALPWTYVPTWFLAQLPLLTTAAIAAGLILTVVLLVKPPNAEARGDLLAAFPIYLQGLALPVAIVVAGSILYDGIRHVLFAVPALIAIAGVGLRVMASMAKRRTWRSKVVPYAVAVLVTVASLVACIRWYPYQYAFINPIAGLDKEHRNWEIDYWGLSGREGVARLKEQGAPLVLVLPNGDSSSIFGGTRNTELLERWPQGAWQYGIYTFLRWENYLPGTCSETVRIERDGILIGNGGLCPPPVEILKEQAAS